MGLGSVMASGGWLARWNSSRMIWSCCTWRVVRLNHFGIGVVETVDGVVLAYKSKLIYSFGNSLSSLIF